METMLSKSVVEGLLGSSIKKYEQFLEEREKLLSTKKEDTYLLEAETHRIRGAIAAYREFSKSLSGVLVSDSGETGEIFSDDVTVADRVPEELKDEPLFDGRD